MVLLRSRESCEKQKMESANSHTIVVSVLLCSNGPKTYSMNYFGRLGTLEGSLDSFQLQSFIWVLSKDMWSQKKGN
jgi:hypothetical protein